jgi:hypothetical protein
MKEKIPSNEQKFNRADLLQHGEIWIPGAPTVSQVQQVQRKT